MAERTAQFAAWNKTGHVIEFDDDGGPIATVHYDGLVGKLTDLINALNMGFRYDGEIDDARYVVATDNGEVVHTPEPPRNLPKRAILNVDGVEYVVPSHLVKVIIQLI